MTPVRRPDVENTTSGLMLLAAEHSVVVTGEEHHQDALTRHAPGVDGRPRRVAVELRFAPIRHGRHTGQRGVEVLLDGRRVGELTRRMSQRYGPLLDHVLAAGGRPGCVAQVVNGRPDAGGRPLVEVRLRLPAEPEGWGVAAPHPAPPVPGIGSGGAPPVPGYGPGAGHGHDPGAAHGHDPGAAHGHGSGAAHGHGPGAGHGYGSAAGPGFPPTRPAAPGVPPLPPSGPGHGARPGPPSGSRRPGGRRPNRRPLWIAGGVGALLLTIGIAVSGQSPDATLATGPAADVVAGRPAPTSTPYPTTTSATPTPEPTPAVEGAPDAPVVARTTVPAGGRGTSADASSRSAGPRAGGPAARTTTSPAPATARSSTAKSSTAGSSTARSSTATKKPAAAASGGCDPNYSGCVPIASDVDCAGGSGNGPAYVSGPIRVTGTDKYDLDRDGNGIACE